MTIQEIARRLHAKKSGKGYMAVCPAHQDDTPSLSLREGYGSILVHCFGPCSNEEVIAVLRDMGLWAAASGSVKPKPWTRREVEFAGMWRSQRMGELERSLAAMSQTMCRCYERDQEIGDGLARRIHQATQERLGLLSMDRSGFGPVNEYALITAWKRSRLRKTA